MLNKTIFVFLLSISLVLLAPDVSAQQDTEVPDAPDVEYTASIGGFAILDFSGVTDNVDTFDELTIEIFTQGNGITSNILRHGNFTSGVTLDATVDETKFTVIDPMVTFTLYSNATISRHEILYRAVDRNVNSNFGNLIMNIVAPASASDVSLSIDQGELDNLDFSTVAFDDNTFDELTITFDTDDPVAVGNLLGNGTFGSGVNGTTTPFLVESSMVEFTANAAAVDGVYTFPYAAINQTGARAIGTVSVTIVDITNPITPNLDVFTTEQGSLFILDFSSVTDETGIDPTISFKITDATNAMFRDGGFNDVNNNATHFILVGLSGQFTTNSDIVSGIYPFQYTATDRADNTSMGTMSVIFAANAPSASPIEVSVNQDEDGFIDFSGVTDNSALFEHLIVTFYTDDATATGGNILDHITFDTNTVNGTTSPFGVTSPMVEFHALVRSDPGLYTFPYNATDRADRTSSSTVEITIVSTPDTTAPNAQAIEAYMIQNLRGELDFSSVSDRVNTFDELTIAFDTDDPNAVGELLSNGRFTGEGLNSTSTPFRVTAPTVSFIANLDAVVEVYTIPYTVTDRAGNSDENTLSITILPYPVTVGDVSVSINQGDRGGLDFETIIFMNQLFNASSSITFDTDDPNAVGDLLNNGRFADFGLNGTTTPFKVTDPFLPFSADRESVAGVYTVPYIITDQVGHEHFGRIIIRIVDIEAPVAPDIIVNIIQGTSDNIDFRDVTDDVDTFDQLTITFDTDDAEAVGDLLNNGRFTGVGLNGTTTPFKVTDGIVTFATDLESVAGVYTIPYTATDTEGHETLGKMIIRIIDIEAPIAPNINEFLFADICRDIDFSGVIDNVDTFDQLTITFDTNNPSVLSPFTLTFRGFPSVIYESQFTAGAVGVYPIFTVTEQTVTFEHGSLFPIPFRETPDRLYTIPYTVTDSDGYENYGTMTLFFPGFRTLKLLPEPTPELPSSRQCMMAVEPPSTPNIMVSVNQEMRANLNFSRVLDFMDSVRGLIITFDTNDPDATGGNILDNVNFIRGVNGTTTPFKVIGPIVTFDVNAGARPGVYTIPYTATDRSGIPNSGTITMTIADAANPITPDTQVPFTPNIPVSVNQGGIASIDFNDVTDNTNTFDELTITINTNAPNATPFILRNGTFSNGVTGTAPSFTIISETVEFTVNLDARPGVYTIPYTAIDGSNNDNSGTVTMTIGIDTTAPTAPIIPVPVNPGAPANIDFSIISDDTDYTFEHFTVTFDTDDPEATPNILSNGAFTAGTNSTDMTPFRVINLDEQGQVEDNQDGLVEFTANANAQPGDYSIPYTVTDRAGNENSGTVAMTIDVDDIPPTTPSTTAEPAPQPRRSGGGGGGSSGGGGGGGGSGGGSSILNIGSFAPHLAMYDQCDTDGKVRIVASAQSNNLQASITSNGKTYTGIDVTDKVDASKYITTSATPFIFDFETEKLNSFVIKMSIDSSSGISYPVNVDECISHKKLFSNAGVNIATPAQPYFEFDETQDTSAQSNKESQITESVLKQYKQGVPISEIVCQDSANTVLESPSGKPYCMTDSSSATLIDRGYTSV